MAFAMVCIGSVSASAAGYDDLPQGTYQITASLSCYVNAMGGVEFGGPLLKSATVRVASDGSRTMTLHLGKSQVTIYNITCDTFVDAAPSYVTETNGITAGTIGYYTADGKLVTGDASYALSSDTAENAQKEQIHYVDTVTFPIDRESSTYYLTLYVNSNVMGTQFTKDGYPAVLTVDWSSVDSGSTGKADNTASVPESGKGNSSSNNSGSSAAAETEAPASTANVEKKAGLDIYHATKDDEPLSEADGYIAFFKEPVLIAVAVIGGVLVLCGAALMIVGAKGRKK